MAGSHAIGTWLPKILSAAQEIVRNGVKLQTPLVINAIWRTEGQKPILEEHAFDVFVWTDMAFLELFIDIAQKEIEEKNNDNLVRDISRPTRSLVWLIKSLWDYTTQGSINFDNIHSEITYGAQTDKAGAFSGNILLKYLGTKEFFEPRITRGELENILSPQALDFLLPERRLDAAITIQHLINHKRGSRS